MSNAGWTSLSSLDSSPQQGRHQLETSRVSPPWSYITEDRQDACVTELHQDRQNTSVTGLHHDRQDTSVTELHHDRHYESSENRTAVTVRH